MTDPISRLNAALEGRYRTLRELGAGGMATVYLADDIRHDRKVAIKVLKPELAAVIGADRFLAEIRTTANLQHPHILPLHDSGEADGFLYYVMPYVEGESLRERLDRERQLPVDESVAIAVKIATALQAAHDQGVIHRDVKPANMLLSNGEPLVADFGIGLAVSAAGGDRLTQTGLSLGTPAYMSPEQAGAEQDLDGRTDIYSLAATLYEMLAGHPPFGAPTTPALLLKVLTEEPESVSELRPSVPGNVDAAIATALAKLPADRFSTARAFVAGLSDSTYGPQRVARVSGPPTGLRWLWPVATTVASLAAVYAWTRPPPPGPLTHTQINLPEGRQFGVTGGSSNVLAVSHDGSMLVYVGEDGTERRLYLRPLDSDVTLPLPGTEGAGQPFFSPDDEWVAFFTDRELKRVRVSGGQPITVAELPSGASSNGGAWSEDGTILYSAAGLYRVGWEGAEEPRQYPIPDTLAGPSASWPDVLPGGRYALVNVRGGTAIVDLQSGGFERLLSGDQARYLPSGHLLYNGGEERALLVPFDLDRREIRGAPFPAIDEDVLRGPGAGALNVAVSDNGTLVYVRGGFERELVLVDRSGRERPVSARPMGYRFPRLSPDGRLLAVTVDPRPSDLWIVDLEDGTAVPQPMEGHDGWGVWSPDGSRVAGVGSGPGAWFWIRDYPFVGPAEPVPDRGHTGSYPLSWAPDGRLLVTRGGPALAAVDATDGTVTTLIEDGGDPGHPRISPDGRWLAYTSEVSGVREVYVVAYPNLGERYQVSRGGGTDPSWAADGSELFYRVGNTIVAVAVRISPDFAVLGSPEVLFTGLYNFFQRANWIARPQGDFLMIKSDPASARQIQVVQNWFTRVEGGGGA